MSKAFLIMILLCAVFCHSIAQSTLLFYDSLNNSEGIYPTTPAIIKKAAIKMVMQFNYTNKECTDSFLSFKYGFDTSGNLTERIRYFRKSGSGIIDSFIYDNKNQLIEHYFSQSKDRYLLKSINTYAGDSIETSIDTAMVVKDFTPMHLKGPFSLKREIDFETSNFNQQHKLAEKIGYDSSHIIIYDYKYVYGEDGSLQKILFSYKEKPEEFTYKYSFSRKGMKITLYQSFNGKNEKKEMEFIYNKQGQCVQSIDYGFTYTEYADNAIYNSYTYNTDGTLSSYASQKGSYPQNVSSRYYYIK